MPHEVESEELSAHLDGALPPEREAAVALHLSACVDCRGRLEGLRRASARFRAQGAAKAPAELRAKLLGACRAPKDRWKTARDCVLWLGVGLAGLSLLGKAFKPQVSSVFNQVMGMVSGAAQGVASPK